MPIEVILPKVDMDMETGTIEAWKVSEGEVVTEGQLLFEIGTSKAVMEVEAPASGIIRRISAKQGETVAVGAPVAWIYGVNEIAEATSLVAGQFPSTPKFAANDAVATSAERTPPALPAGRLRATPLARRMAREQRVDLSSITGTGPRGRIGEADVRTHIAMRSSDSRPLSGPPPAPATSPAPTESGSGGELIRFSSVRRIVARRLTESATSVPHFFVSATIDMGDTLALLRKIAAANALKGHPKPSITAFLAHAVGRILVDHPLLNASVEGEAVRLHAGRHIGIAMDRDGDLVVPVIRDAGKATLAETVSTFEMLRRAVQDRSLKPSQMEGGTFTISNLGMFGVDHFTAIINPPQTGILAVGRIVDIPAAVKGEIVLRPLATFCLSSDHRVVDGVVAARFMADLRQILQNPELLL